MTGQPERGDRVRITNYPNRRLQIVHGFPKKIVSYGVILSVEYKEDPLVGKADYPTGLVLFTSGRGKGKTQSMDLTRVEILSEERMG